MKIKLLVVSLLLPMAAIAQQGRPMTLSEVLKLSSENNSQVKLAEARISTASARIDEARMQILPDIKLGGTFMVPFNTLVLKSNIPDLAKAPIQNPQFVAFQALNLGIPLFMGFKIKDGILIADYQKDLLEHQLESDKETMATAATQGFVDLFKARKSIEVLQQNLARAHQRSLDFEKLEQNGVVAINDVDAVKLQESKVKLSLQEAKKNVNVLNYNLCILMDLPTTTEIRPDLGNDNTVLLEDEQQLQADAKGSREEFKILEDQHKIGELNVHIAKGKFLPTVTGTAGYTNAWAPKIIQINHIASVGLSLNWNISSLFKNKSAVQVAQLQNQEITAQQKVVDDQIKQKVHQAYEEFQLSTDNIKVLTEAAALANENFSIVKKKFDNGLETTTDLLDADVNQLEAQLNLLYGQANQKWAHFNLLRQAGKIKFNNN